RLDERASMARVDRLTEIDASEDGEDVGLQESDQQFQRRKGDREAEWHDCPEPTEKAEGAQHGNETTEYFERDVTGKHVGEQPYAMGDGPRQKYQHLDERHQGHVVNRHPSRPPHPEEIQPA